MQELVSEESSQELFFTQKRLEMYKMIQKSFLIPITFRGLAGLQHNHLKILGVPEVISCDLQAIPKFQVSSPLCSKVIGVACGGSLLDHFVDSE